MRKLIARSVLALLAVLIVSSTASAAAIPIGALQWIVLEYDLQGAPVDGQFSVVNQTGVNWQDPDFPVVTQLTFDADLNLEVHFDSAPDENIGQGSMTSPDGGLSWDTAVFGLPPFPVFAQLTGHVSPLTVVLDGGGVWNLLTGAIYTIPGALGDDTNPIGDGDTAIIYVDAEQAVPEPSTLILFGTGAIGVIMRRRKLARR